MPTRRLEFATLAVVTLLCVTSAKAQSPYSIGRVATTTEIAGWNIDVGGDGSNLPPGSGSVSHGSEVFGQQCAACHGAKGEGGVGDRLVGGQGTLGTPKPVRTVGSYGPYAPTLFNYIRRAMPQNAPQSLSNDDVYAVSAYILSSTACCRRMRRLMPRRLPQSRCLINMFVGDSRPDVKNPECMSGC